VSNAFVKEGFTLQRFLLHKARKFGIFYEKTHPRQRTRMGIALNDRNKGRKTSGLTLVELLIVITMTGILSALLLPALSTAKEKSRRAICASNLRQLIMVVQEYANENDNYLPSCADDKGYYHSIILSDSVFTNLVDYAGGSSNIFYCPNIVFGSGANSVRPYIPNVGYVIGYSYLEVSVSTSDKAPDYTVLQKKWPANATNELFADANYWVPANASSGGVFKPSMKVAPHTSMGGFTTQGSSFTVNAPGESSASVGAVGGNVGFVDGSVFWRNLLKMQTNYASSINDAYGIW
jgi:type II secretory pathway pseudopilin PulG